VTLPHSCIGVCSEIRPDIIGLIIDNHKAIQKDITIMGRNHSLNPNSANKKDRNRSIIRSIVFLLYFSAISAAKKSITKGNLVTANKTATLDKVRLLAIATIGINRNPI